MQLIAVQFDIAWEDRAANFAKVRSMLAKSPPARGGLVALPEMFGTGFSMNLDAVVDETGETERFLGQLAREHAVYVIGGVATRGPDGRGRNEAVVIGPGGNVVTRYQKIFPFTLGKEAQHFSGGQDVVTFRCWDARPSPRPSPGAAGEGEIRDDRGFTVAPFVCYDLRFPEIFRVATVRGAQLIVVIANWPAARVEHWTTLLRARAIENQAYVVGVNRCGRDPNLAYPGKSVIIDPRGITLAEAGGGEEVISAQADVKTAIDYRRELPFLNDIRQDFLPQMNTDTHR